MADSVKRMPIAEFRRRGFLQEANRLFFHPHGLALEVAVGDDGAETFGGVWDYRDDPEGVVYGDTPDPRLAEAVARERDRHRETRAAMFAGSDVQPCHPVAHGDDLDAHLRDAMLDRARAGAFVDVVRRQEMLRALVARRTAVGLTLQQVADGAGMPLLRVAAIEGGECEPHVSELMSYARAVGARVALAIEEC